MRKINCLTKNAYEAKVSDIHMPDLETCMNPWSERCPNTDIALYVLFKGNRLPLCHRCWKAVSSKNIEWAYN